MPQLLRLVAALCLLIGTAGCFLPGDAALKLRGVLVDEKGRQRSDCKAWLYYTGSQPQLLGELPTGEIDVTVVFRPFSAPLLRFTCAATTAVAELPVPRMPTHFGTPADLGKVVLVSH